MRPSYIQFLGILTLLLGILMLNSCKTTADFNYLTHTYSTEEINKIDVKFEKAYAMLLGHFSNKAQSDTTSSLILKEQEIINVPFWRKRSGEYWMYSGWFKAGFIENAIRENVFQLVKRHRDTFDLIMYKMPSDRNYSNVWQEEKPFAHLNPADMVEVCRFYIVEARDRKRFKLYTPGDPCNQSDMSERIAFVEYLIDLTPNQQQHFSIFYNQDKKVYLKYGRPDGIIFDRLDKSEPKYLPEEE